MSRSELFQLPPVLRKQLELRTADASLSVADLQIKTSLPLVWSLSDFVAQSCLRNPELLPELESSGDLLRGYQPGELAQKLEQVVFNIETEDELKRALRRLRQREMVRIAWRDLSGWADLQEVMATVSELADSCIQAAQSLANQLLAGCHGQPVDRNGDSMQMSVLGMGKLGARELNFSSDIDLIFSYPAEGETSGNRPLSHREYFIRLGKKIIQILGEATADGFVFRVDMRLRPNGNSGALAYSFDAMDKYYLVHGREWERYALVKARIITSKDSGAELMQRLQPFVYRKYIDYTVIENLRELKNSIEHELRRKGIKYNVKLGPGGIREIEFIAQAWQLIRGGREPGLQDRRLLVIFDRLLQKQLLPAQAIGQLRDAYVYLRRLEHRLQMINDQQTQVLPNSELDQCRIATAMGYDCWDAFMLSYQDKTAAVQRVFDGMFSGSVKPEVSDGVSDYINVWQGATEPPNSLDIIRSAGYGDPESALQLLTGLREGRAYSVFSSAAKDRMDRLIPMAIEICGNMSNANAVLARLIRILEAIGQRTAYIALLAENRTVLEQLVRLSAASAWIANWIALHPVLLDELFDPRLLYGGFDEDQVRDELRQQVSHIPEDDLEMQMNAVREFRHAQLLRTAAVDISDSLDDREVSRRLCLIAQICLEFCLDVAWRDLTQKHGEPGSSGESGERGVIIVGYGKLGSIEMGYTSDIDLVFIHRQVLPSSMTRGNRSIPDTMFFQRLAQKIVSLATARTYAGRLYEVDVRLRPNGLSGAPASGVEAWMKYQRNKAWVWEHQALVRARSVTGDANLSDDFEQRRVKILRQGRKESELKKAVLNMRQKMLDAEKPESGFDIKKHRGGMVDIEFLVQYMVLRWADELPQLTNRTETSALLKLLLRAGVLRAEDEEILSAAWLLYLKTEHRKKLMEESPVVNDRTFKHYRDEVIRIWDSLLK